MDVKDGKISLSIKAVEDKEEIIEEVEEAPINYTSGEEASTGLGDRVSSFFKTNMVTLVIVKLLLGKTYADVSDSVSRWTLNFF